MVCSTYWAIRWVIPADLFAMIIIYGAVVVFAFDPCFFDLIIVFPLYQFDHLGVDG